MDKKREDNIDSKKLKKSRATKKFIETDKIPGAFLCFAYEMKTTSPLVFWVYTRINQPPLDSMLTSTISRRFLRPPDSPARRQEIRN